MLIKLLGLPEQRLLLNLVNLLSLSDNPLHWTGKDSDSGASEPDLYSLTISIDDQEKALIKTIEYEILSSFDDDDSYFGSNDSHYAVDVKGRLNYAMSMLISEIKKHPESELESEGTRLTSVLNVLEIFLRGESFDDVSVPKIILYEMFLVALSDGHISDIEMAVLKSFQAHFEIEDFMFDEILERAEALTQEISTTISLVLE
jgi:hypothetical protein